MNCSNCGVEIVPGAKFCSNCGKAVSGTAAVERVSPGQEPRQTAEAQAKEEAAPEASSSAPTKTSPTKRWVIKAGRWLGMIVLTIVIGKVLEYVSGDIRQFLQQADDFVWTGVKEGQPFHFCAMFYREWVHGGSPPEAFVRAVGDIITEGPAAVLTMVLVLFIGATISYDPKTEYPVLKTLYTTLFLGPIIGGCLLYVLMAVMAGLGLIFGVGAKVFTYIGTVIPVVKEGVGIAIESKKEKMAEKMVDRMSTKVKV
jgi:zinc-ribbon domain